MNERDELGNDLVPDYLTSVKDGAFYGWPYSYFGQHVDKRVQPPRPDLVAKAIAPDYALGAHVAPLGLAFSESARCPVRRAACSSAQHGSWNRKPLSGYKVVFVPFLDGSPGRAGRRPDGLREREGEAYGPAGRRGDRSARRAAGRRRRRQRDLARRALSVGRPWTKIWCA